MRTGKLVYFLNFETTLDSNEFISKWESYLRPANSDADVTLQKSKKNNLFNYLAQHCCDPGEFQFLFKKAAKTTHLRQIEVRAVQLGGYSLLEEEHNGNAQKNESKIFIFLSAANNDLEIYKQLNTHGKLNIYEAYFENCEYAFILEYLVSNSYVQELQQQLQQHTLSEPNVYKVHPLKTLIPV